MNRIFQLSMLTALAATAVQAAGDPRQEIALVHRDFANALVAKNYEEIERIYDRSFAPDFKAYRSSGEHQSLKDWRKFNKQDLAARAKGRADGPTKYDSVFRNWQVAGNTVTVDVVTNGVGEWLKGNRRLPVVFRQTVRETWKLQNGKWIAKSFKETSITGTVDGKPVPPGKG